MKNNTQVKEENTLKTFRDGIIESLKTQTTAWLVGIFVTILTIFSSQITESIKFSINRANLRTSQHEQIASEISRYIFWAETSTDFIENNWTTKPSLEPIIREYNSSVVSLREKEFVYLDWIEKYWSKDEAADFEDFMHLVEEFDSTIHSLNDEFEAVNILESQEKIKSDSASDAVEVMRPAVEKMRAQGRDFLYSLN